MPSQIFLILWKDYIVRKRKPITVGGLIWAAATIISLVIVRFNVFQDDKPTCQFPSRALPSVGVLPFLQSFICTVNNECNPLDQYEAIPKYTNSGLTALQNEFSPIFNNETVFETVEIIPNSVKLLSTVTKIIDNEGIHDFVYDGFRIAEIFKNPENVINIASKRLKSPEWIFRKLLYSPIKLENIINLISSINELKCDEDFFRKIFILDDQNDASKMAQTICNIKMNNLEKQLFDLLYEINITKYTDIIDDIVFKLSHENTVKNLGRMLDSTLQLTNFQNYVPDEIKMENSTRERSYVNMRIIKRFVKVFQSMFGSNKAYKSLLSTIDALTDSSKVLNRFFNSNTQNNNNNNDTGVKKMNYFNDKVRSVILSLRDEIDNRNLSSSSILNVLGGVMEVILKLLPDDTKHAFHYYMTLMDKMLSGVQNLIRINLHMEEIMYNISSRHPKGIEKISKLGPGIMGKFIDGLMDANRVQILTGKIFHPGQMFCDMYKLQVFLKVSKTEASRVKPIVCDSAWKNFAVEIVDGFGVNNISSTISKTASLVIAETVSKASDARLITIEDFLRTLSMFFEYIAEESLNHNKNKSDINWGVLFRNNDFKEIEQVIKSKSDKTNLLLVTVNTALAKQVITNNAILDTHISPVVIKIQTVLKSVIEEINEIPLALMKQIKKHFVGILESILLTMRNSDKILNVITSDFTTVFCEMDEACKMDMDRCDDMLRNDNKFVNFPTNKDAHTLVNLFCNITSAISEKLDIDFEDNKLFKTLEYVEKNPDLGKGSQVDWTDFIKTMQELYKGFDKYFDFLFDLRSYFEKENFSNLHVLVKKLESHILSNATFEDGLKIGTSSAMSILQILGSNVFGLKDTSDWIGLEIKMDGMNSFIYVADQFLQGLKALTTRDELFLIEDLPITYGHIKDIVFNIPDLIEELAIFITKRNDNIQTLIDIMNDEDLWPCVTSNSSIANVMMMNENANLAIRSLEAFLCIDDDMKTEWKDFIHFSKIFRLVLNDSSYDDTLTPKVFLKSANTFNNFISDLFDLEEFIATLDTNEGFKLFQKEMVNSWTNAVKLVNISNGDNKILKRFFKNIDLLLDSTRKNESESPGTPSEMWESYVSCNSYDNNTETFDECKRIFWKSLKYSMLYISEAGTQMASDLAEYFSELSEANVSVLQFVGFTKRTGPNILFNKLPHFLDVLINSFLDQGFMKQIYRSLGRQFWDCDRIMSSLKIPTYSKISRKDVDSIKPFICPSLVYWVSIPTDENVLLDLFAKSQFIFFNKPISNYTASFEKFYDQMLILHDNITVISKRKDLNATLVTDEWIEKFVNIGKTLILNGGTVETQAIFKSSYIIDTLNLMYLSEITKMMSTIGEELKDVNNSDSSDLRNFIKYVEKKPKNMLEIFMYAFTKELLDLSDPYDFNITKSLDRICTDNFINTNDEPWMKPNVRILKNFCKINYGTYLRILNDRNVTLEGIFYDFINATLEIGEAFKDKSKDWKQVIIDITNISKPNNFTKTTIEYMYELKLNSYFEYLNMKMDHNLISLNFLNGDDWWKALRRIYDEPNSRIILDFVEKSPKIVEDIMDNLPKIKIVRLLKDMKFNDTGFLCEVDFSEYFPDATGALSDIKNFFCGLNLTEFYMEIKPVKLAAGIYDEEYVQPEDIADEYYYSRNKMLKDQILTMLKEGPKKPSMPSWITPEVEEDMKNISTRLNSESGKIDVAFFIINNFMDALTLFVNTSSSIPSNITPWIKQIKLQLIKNEEYTTFLCELKQMSNDNIYSTLINEFHWDIALSEIMSNRNYTWLEMNKSLNQLFELIRHHVHNSINDKFNKLSNCFFNSNITNSLHKASLYLMLGSNVMKMIESSAPHFKDISNFKSHPTWNSLFSIMKDNLPVEVDLENVFLNTSSFPEFAKNSTYGTKGWKLNLNKIIYDCSDDPTEYCYDIENNGLTLQISSKNLNTAYISENLLKLQQEEFWSFKWFSKIISSIGRFLSNFAHAIQKISTLDWEGLYDFRIKSVVDFVLQFEHKTFAKSIASYIDNILLELKPILSGFDLDIDIKNLANGLRVLRTFIDGIFNNIDPKFEIGSLFQNWNEIKFEVVSKTNLSIVTIDTIQAATLNLKPILDAESEDIRISEYVCKTNYFMTVFQTPKNISLSTLNEVRKQLCVMTDKEVQTFVTILVKNVNTTRIFDEVVKIVMKQIMTASNLTQDEGMEVVEKIGDVLSLMPTMRGVLTNVSNIIENEPLIKSFMKASKFSNLLYDSGFFADIGNMLCGKPFIVNVNRFYRAIIQVKDTLMQPDQKQLDALPSDYCRRFYQEILEMDGGKILWSYAKPLLMGKILYTPDNINIKNILTNANESFSEIGRLFNLLQGVSSALISLEDIVEHKSGLFTMQKLLDSQSVMEKLAEMLKIDLSFSPLGDVNLNDLLDNFKNTSFLKRATSMMSNMTKCIQLDRFSAVQSEKELEKEATRLMEVNEFFAGIVFLNNDQNANVQYKIRMDIDNVPSTSRIKNRFWMPGPNPSFIEHLRYFRGFVQLQDMIDKAIIKTSSESSYRNNSKRITRDVDVQRDSVVKDWGVYTQQMPYPCYIQDEFKTILYESQALVIAFFFSLILVVASIVRNLIWERESGNTDLMCVMRMKRRNHTLSWFIASLIEVLVTMLILYFILKFGNILPKSNSLAILLVLFNFGLSVVMFCYMVTSFFKSASLGAVCAVIIYLIFFMPYVIVLSLEALLTFPQKIITSLFMSTGFCYTVLLMARYEVQGVGLQWTNINESPLIDDPISVANMSLIILFDSLLYFIIGYVINRIRFDTKIHVDMITNDLVSSSMPIGVRIENVTKTYKNSKGSQIKALDDVNIDLYKGQITTLLGHNGAGKTTLIKILTGATRPNSGKIIVNKQNIGKEDDDENKDVVKNHIGLCPQNDVLLEFMSSREHLFYYARLKTNSSHKQVKYDVESMLETMGLCHLSEEPVNRLSGGLRRRLSVGLAFIANPHLVILDEPSSGVDPVARRDIWSLIVSLKGDRTILLTTHHLDEAELLSDTLIIMHKGKILTNGSPLELKHKYGSGYKLTITYPLNMAKDLGKFKDYTSNEPCNDNVKELLNNIQELVANSSLNSITGNVVNVNLPFLSSDEQHNNFSALMRLLEEKKPVLKYSSLAVECSSMEQVFLNICKKAESEDPGVFLNNDEQIENHVSDVTNDSSETNSINNFNGNKNEDYPYSDQFSLINDNENLTGTFVQKLMALLKKRFLHYRRNYRLLIITLLLPAIFVAFAMGFSLIRPPDDSLDPLDLNSALYNKFSVEFASLPPEMNGLYENSVIQSLVNDSIFANNRTLQNWEKSSRCCECIDSLQKCTSNISFYNNFNSIPAQKKFTVLESDEKMVDWIVNTQDIFTEKRYGGWSSSRLKSEPKSSYFKVWYNNKGDHALPAYLNTINSGLLKYKTKNEKLKITTYNHPLKLSVEQLSRSTLMQHVADVGIGVVLLVGFGLVPAGGVIYLVNERTSQEKRLQLLCGVSPFTYWLSSLIWDVLIIIGAMILSICVIEIFALPVYLYKENIPAICLLLLLYGISCSPLMHILEKLFVDASLANMILFCANVFVGCIGLTILLIIDVLSKSEHADNVRWNLHKFFLIFPQFALGDGLIEISKNTIQATVLSRFGMDTYLSPLGWELMGPHYLALGLTAVFFFMINLLYEYDMLDSLFTIFKKKDVNSTDNDMEEYDVMTEKYRVELAILKPHYNKGFSENDLTLTKSDKSQDQATKMDTNDILQILQLKKIYTGVLENRVAVKDLTFGVKSGQCFGLLGVNGAGKSTTFKMLTGEVKPTSGQIFVAGKSVTSRQLCNGTISYCPQIDSLDTLLTVTEHLEFYCNLRGLSNKEEKITNAINEFDLVKYKNQLSQTLSGGNKRKLCTAISFIGNSPIVLLDEPTSGMDPGARYNIGKAIKRATKNGRCLLLSSHSLVECETLCQRVAVTALGRFLAIGPPNYLKHKYGGGYLVSIRLKSPNQKGQLVQIMSELFPKVQIQNFHYCTTQFMVPINNQGVAHVANHNEKKNDSVNTQLSDIFTGLSRICTKLDVIDYSINQSSLDQVFINFSSDSIRRYNTDNDVNGQIKLSTLERHYSKNKNINSNLSQEDVFVTKL